MKGPNILIDYRPHGDADDHGEHDEHRADQPPPRFLDLTSNYGDTRKYNENSNNNTTPGNNNNSVNTNNNNNSDNNDNNNNNNNNNNSNNSDTQELVQVTIIPASEYALKGVSNSLHVLFQIKTAPKPTHQERPPCDIAIVLDRSVSMTGEKLEYSKLAINHIIDNLGENDRLHLIAYAIDAVVVFEDGNLTDPEKLKETVNSLQPVYYTNIYEGLSMGADVLKRHRIEGDSRPVQRIFLFSDGLATKGNKHPDEIKELVRQLTSDRSLSVTSFGLGSDFDEDLMKSIAELGSGDYFFIEDATSIHQHVQKSLSALLSSVGSSPVLKIRGTNGGIVKKIFARTADEVVHGVHLGDLKQDNLRQILCVVEVCPSHGDGGEILTWSLQYTPDGQQSSTPPTTTTTLKGSLHIKYTDDDELVYKVNPAVLVAKTIQEIGETDAAILSLLDKGKLEEAIEMKQHDLEKLEKIEYLDSNRMVTALIQKTKRGIARMRDKKVNTATVRKATHYNTYIHNSGSHYLYSYDI